MVTDILLSVNSDFSCDTNSRARSSIRLDSKIKDVTLNHNLSKKKMCCNYFESSRDILKEYRHLFG